MPMPEAMDEIQMGAGEALRVAVLRVRLVGAGAAIFRLRLAVRLIKLAALVGGFKQAEVIIVTPQNVKQE